eukprot:COSAG02_NODE_2324_length_9133_cov_38.463361_7_plen_306_part_00
MYRNEEVVERVDKLFQHHLEVHEEAIQNLYDIVDQSDAGGGVEMNVRTALTLQRAMSESYVAATQALLKAHDDYIATVDDEGKRVHRRGGLEWTMRAESIALHDRKAQRAKWFAARGEEMPVAEQKAFAQEAMRLAKADAEAWLNTEIAQLHRKEGNAHEFHQWWHHLLRWGRRARTGARWFHGDDGEMATTMEEELEGWAAYQEHKAKATDAGQADWEPLPDTRGVTCPEWVVDTVLDHVAKENKATGRDGVSVTLWRRIPTARRVCKALVRLMWCYELPGRVREYACDRSRRDRVNTHIFSFS